MAQIRKWRLNSKLKPKISCVDVDDETKESVNIMNCALYRLKRRLNKLQNMQITHLPPFLKEWCNWKGEKKKS